MRKYIVTAYVIGMLTLATQAHANAQVSSLSYASTALAADGTPAVSANDIANAVAPLATNAALSAVVSTIPTPSGVIAPQPANGGIVGTPGTYMPGGVAPKFIVQSANAVTDSTGSWSVTFNQAFASATPTANAFPVISSSATQPMTCNVITRTTTTIAGKCFGGQTIALNLSIVTAGLTLNPNAAAPAGVAVMVYARDATQ